ncbi:unnamed protein product [Coregonus sp. 'balchen']|nr:unnamed protein product [Coregonus sp. 'balchen']
MRSGIKNEDLEAINLDLRHRISVVEAQGKAVIQQKAELEAMSQARQQELGALQQEVARLKEERQEWELYRKGAAEKELPPSESVMTVPTPLLAKATTASTPSLIYTESDHAMSQIQSLVPASAASIVHNYFWAECRGNHEFLGECFESEESPPLLPLCDEEQDEAPDALDQKESDRPRFTLQDLQDVLQERNELKAQVFMLREELIYYKSEELEDEINSINWDPPHQSEPATVEQPDSGIKHLISIFSGDMRRPEEVPDILPGELGVLRPKVGKMNL